MKQEQITNAINEKSAAINELKRKLGSTDYVVTRNIEQGIEIPSDFKNERQGWRDDINQLEAEIRELESYPLDEEI